jgi:acyl-CoA reductase-like NAD-dependent aldehyde dehydrogenase
MAAQLADGSAVALDSALQDLQRSRARWAALAVEEKARLLQRLLGDLHAVAGEWAGAAAGAKGAEPGSAAAGEEWITFAFLLKAVAMLHRSLQDVARCGRPRIPGPIRPRGIDQAIVQVFPQTFSDRVLFPGLASEIWTEPGVGVKEVTEEQAAIYRRPAGEGRTALVLGAGNVSILGACDVLDKLFCDGAVVVLKTHPVTDHLTPLLERGLSALIEPGFLRIVRGGAAEGSYLAGHPLVDELHVTGSERTHDAIVFGPGEEGWRRKAARQPAIAKRFTCELGSVSPVIVVPGPWTPADLRYQAAHLAGTLVNNAGFNCLSTRVIVQHARWNLRDRLLDALREVLSRTPSRPAWYPGARETYARFVSAHPEAERFGDAARGRLPWTLIPSVDANRRDDICFRTEGFCSLFAETPIDAANVPVFLDAAVRFANGSLWGSLTCTLLVHPVSLRDPEVAAAVERAAADLCYGTVGLNVWGASNFVTMAGSWGAFPGHPSHDIQSGSGTVHNFLMIPRPQKTVVRGPFRQAPKPLVFPGNRAVLPVGRRLVDFYARPSPAKLAGIVLAALRG